MEPKKSFAQKPKWKAPSVAHSGDSSEDDHTYGNKFLHFIDEEARKAHWERYANREVLTGQKVNFDTLGDIGSLFQAHSLTPFLASIGDLKYYPHLVSQFYANLVILADTYDSYLLGKAMTFDELLIGQLLKIPSSGIDITLSIEELGLNYPEINKTISVNKKSTFIPNKINQLTRTSRIIAYSLAANIIQKK